MERGPRREKRSGSFSDEKPLGGVIHQIHELSMNVVFIYGEERLFPFGCEILFMIGEAERAAWFHRIGSRIPEPPVTKRETVNG